MLQQYLNIVETYFSNQQIDHLPLSQQEYTDLLLPEFINACKAKGQGKSEAEWADLLEEIAKLDWVNGSIRDMSYDSNYSFSAIIHIKLKENEVVGIVIHVSYIGNLIGMHYSDDKSDNANPIIAPVKKQIKHLSQGSVYRDVSYFPFHDLHFTYQNALLAIIEKHFPSFEVFDNKFAEYKVNEIQTEAGYYHNMDLFQVFFGTRIDNIF